MPSTHPRDNPAVLILDTNTLDGVAEEPESNAQVLVIATDTGDGNLLSVGRDAPFSIADASPTLEPMGGFGAVVPADGGLVIDVNPNRLKLDVMNPNAIRIWLGLGEVPTVGVGDFIDPGGCFTEYTTSSVYTVAQDGSEHTVCGQEWAA